MKRLVLLIVALMALSFCAGAGAVQHSAQQELDRQYVYAVQLRDTIVEQDKLIADYEHRLADKQQELNEALLRGNRLRDDQRELLGYIGTLVHEIRLLKKYGGLTEYRSRSELEQWLYANPISERTYKPYVYDCEDFAMDLSIAAAQDGYIMGLLLKEGRRYDHLKAFTPIGNKVWEIEPQNDGIKRWGVLD